jgi:Uma2 family endonuclease
MTNAASPSVIYPESDGLPMSESDATRDYLVYSVEVLREYFRSRGGIYVSGNLFIYYQEGDSSKVVSPDVFVIFGVNQYKRRSYKAWLEGNKLPQFVLEITSFSTRKQDEVTKPELYASLGVTEYFQYDPTGDYLTPQLKGQRLVDGAYRPLDLAPNAAGQLRIHSQVLGLDLCLEPPDQPAGLEAAAFYLRFHDPATGNKLLSYSELITARGDAEQGLEVERQNAAAERQKAESESQRAESESQRAESEFQRAESEFQRAESESQRAESESQRAEAEYQRAERLAARLRALGLDPEASEL